MRLPAVLFDFDGTLMDSEPAIIASYEHVFEIYADVSEFTPGRRVEVLGPPLDVEMKKFFPKADVNEVIEEYRSYQEKHLKELLTLMDGSEELLKWLKEEHYPVGIVTSRVRASLIKMLGLFGLDHYFDVLVCWDDHFEPKPAPDGILYAQEKLGAQQSIYVGDSISDLQAGRNAGSIVIAALTKQEKEQSLLEFHPDYAVHHMIEIREILRKINE